MNEISLAINIAVNAHDGQVDKSGEPYIFHPLRVMLDLQKQGAKDEVVIAGVLHDVVEDSPWTLTQIEALGIPILSTDIIFLLTKNKGEPNIEYYKRIREHSDATQVKLADIKDNSDPKRLAKLDFETRNRLLVKYDVAKSILLYK